MKRYGLSALWLLFLAAFILIGVPDASFHGDETSFIYSSRDYAALFLRGKPQDVSIDLPVDDDVEYLRLVDGSLARYSIGLAWYLAGYSESDLPTHNFNWTTGYAENLADGRIPGLPLLTVARLPSATFLTLSVAVMFALGWRFGGQAMAFVVSGLYALNPIIVLNGRRALQEGGLLCFGLLTMLVGAIISQRRERGHVPLALWIGLIVAGALALVSKNNGFVYVAAAYLWILAPDLPRPRALLRTAGRLVICGALTIALFVALSPGMWRDPVRNTLVAAWARVEAMQDQAAHDPEAPTTLARRASDILTQPFLRPLDHWESGSPNAAEGQSDLIAAYDASPISGIHFGAVLGVPLTLLAILGVVASLSARLRPYRSAALARGLLLWLGVNIVVLLGLPLPWQRYFLSLIPVATILAAVGLWAVVGWARAAA